VHAKDKVLAD